MILSEILATVCNAYRQCWVAGVADSGTNSSIISTALVGQKILPGNFVQINGTNYLITEYDQVIGSISFVPPCPTSVSTGSLFTVTPRSQAELIDALTRVVYSMGDSWKVPRLDESNDDLKILNTGIFTLPTDCGSVSAVWIKRSNQSIYADWETFPYWEVISDNGINKLFITSSFYGKIRIQYYAPTVIPTTINDEISFGGANKRDAIAFVIHRMLYELYRIDYLENLTGEAGKHYKTLSETHRTESERVRGNERSAPIASRLKRQTRSKMKI